MKKTLLVTLLYLTFTSCFIFAQENDPCSAPCLSPSGMQSNATPPADGFSPNNILPCGTSSEDNSTWYTFVPTSPTFKITATSGPCSSGTNIQVTFFEGDDCGSVGAAGCINCITEGSVVIACTPGKQYWVQIDGCAESVCPFTLSYDAQIPLSAPIISGKKTVCAGSEQTFHATLNNSTSGEIIYPAGYTWTVTPSATKIAQDDDMGTISFQFPKAGKYKICVKPKFGKCPPPSLKTGCLDINVTELNDSKCDINLCCEDKPFEYNLKDCIKQFSPNFADSVNNEILQIDQNCGSTKTYIIPLESYPTGCKGTAVITATLNPKAIKNIPPILIGELDSTKIGGKTYKCTDGSPLVNNYVNPSPTACDTTYYFILECVKINPTITASDKYVDCFSGQPTKLFAANSVFSPIASGVNTGIKSYLWSTKETTETIDIYTPGNYKVTITYTYNLVSTTGTTSKSVSKVATYNIQAKSISATLGVQIGVPKIIDLKSLILKSNPNFKGTVSPAKFVVNESKMGTSIKKIMLMVNENGCETFIVLRVVATKKIFLKGDEEPFLTKSTVNHDVFFAPENITLYPNPSDGVYNIDFNGNDIPSFKWELFDIQGRAVLKDTNNQKIDIQHLNDGVYFLKLYGEDWNTSLKLMKR